jgi:hypothetical protein
MALIDRLARGDAARPARSPEALDFDLESGRFASRAR